MNAPAIIDERAIRSQYIGSSDVAAILGFSKWKTALDVWKGKTDPMSVPDLAADESKRKILKRGKLLEPVIRELAADEWHWKVIEENERHQDDEHGWMKAEVDFAIREDMEVVNCECKSVSPFAVAEWGDEGTDEIPIEYYAQVMYALMVTGRSKCYVLALFGSDDLVRYVVHRDEETIANMREAVESFWFGNVLGGIAPEPTTLDDIAFLFKMVRGRRIEATPEIVELVEKYRVLGLSAKAAEDEREVVKTEIAAYALQKCREAAGDPQADEDCELFTPDGRLCATYKSQRGAYLDQGRLRTEQPALHASLMAEHEFRVLRPRDLNKPATPKKRKS
jgi:putative phage-type endonuclease